MTDTDLNPEQAENNGSTEDKVTLNSEAVEKSEALEEEALDVEIEKDPIEALQEELAEKDNQMLRLKAETENYKKRLRKDKEDSVQYANEKLLKELLNIYDNFERAQAANNPTLESMSEGVEMILKQFSFFLEKEKVDVIESVGKVFDPTVHEIMCQVESNDHDENIITEEYSKGYTLNGRILRPAKVVVAKAPAAASEEENNDNTDEDSPAS
jgi:molecular chaperone GrpE